MKKRLLSLVMFVLAAAASAWIGLWALGAPSFISQKYIEKLNEFKERRSRTAVVALVDKHYDKATGIFDELRLLNQVADDARRDLPNALNNRYNSANDELKVEMARKYTTLADRINAQFGHLTEACSSYVPLLNEQLDELQLKWGERRLRRLSDEIPQFKEIYFRAGGCALLGDWNWNTGHHTDMNCVFPEISPYSICYSTVVDCDEGRCMEKYEEKY